MRTNEGIDVKLPDGTSIKSTHTALLNLPQLPIEARTAHIFSRIDTCTYINKYAMQARIHGNFWQQKSVHNK